MEFPECPDDGSCGSVALFDKTTSVGSRQTLLATGSVAGVGGAAGVNGVADPALLCAPRTGFHLAIIADLEELRAPEACPGAIDIVENAIMDECGDVTKDSLSLLLVGHRIEIQSLFHLASFT